MFFYFDLLEIQSCIPEADIFEIDLERSVDVSFSVDVIASCTADEKRFFQMLDRACNRVRRDGSLLQALEGVGQFVRVDQGGKARCQHVKKITDIFAVMKAVSGDDIS